MKLTKKQRSRYATLVSRRGVSDIFTYLDIPDAPTFGTTTTIAPTDTNIQTADLGGNTDVILGEGDHTPSVTLTSLVGIEGTPIRFKGVGGTTNVQATRLGSVGLTGGALQITGCEWIELYDLYAYYGQGFKFEGSSENLLFQNIYFDGFEHEDGFAGFLSKTDDGGGSVTPYKIIGSYSFFKNTDGEGIYIGQTNGSLFHNVSLVQLSHIGGHNFGWDCAQFAHVVSMDITNLTLLDGGRLDASGQNRNLQLIDSAGTISNSFFTSAATTGAVYCGFFKCDNYTIKNCYIGGEEEMFIGTGVGEAWYAASTIKGNGTVTIDSCILNISAAGTEAFAAGMDYGHIVVKNCLILDTRSTLFSDGRTDKATYSLIDGGGNQFVSSSHESMNPTFDSEKKITSTYHYNRAMGWRTPTSGVYPTLSSVAISGTEETGETLTATPSGAAAGGGSSVDSYLYQWYRSDDASGTNRALIATNGQSSTYVLVSADETKYLDVECQAVNNLNLAGDVVTSSKTGQIPSSTPAIYTTIDPDILYQLGDWDAGAGSNGEWTDTGNDGGAVLTGSVGEAPGTGASGEATFNGSQGLLGSIGSAWPDSGYTMWMKFTTTNFAEIKFLVELSNNRTIEILTTGEVRFKSTTGYQTTNTLSSGVEYNMWITSDNASTGTIRIEQNDGTVVVNSETGTVANNEPNSGTTSFGQDLEETNRLVGSIFEFGAKVGVVSGANLTSLMTHLKGL